eukprot:1160581-Pelagomonas_calceolata.AAC.14
MVGDGELHFRVNKHRQESGRGAWLYVGSASSLRVLIATAQVLQAHLLMLWVNTVVLTLLATVSTGCC